jgi:hypothetical protein
MAFGDARMIEVIDGRVVHAHPLHHRSGAAIGGDCEGDDFAELELQKSEALAASFA